jgi:hypothetical protein
LNRLTTNARTEATGTLLLNGVVVANAKLLGGWLAGGNGASQSKPLVNQSLSMI